MLKCWAWKPSERPTFKEIHAALENMFMETDINEEVARSLNMTPDGEEEEEEEELEDDIEGRLNSSSTAGGKQSPSPSRSRSSVDGEQPPQQQPWDVPNG